MKVGSFRGVDFPNGMPVPNRGLERFSGNLTLATVDNRHMSRLDKPVSSEGVASSFADALTGALSKTEQLDVTAKKLTEQAIYDPDSVDTHTVILASEKARFALNLSKTISDGMIRAFKDLTNPR